MPNRGREDTTESVVEVRGGARRSREGVRVGLADMPAEASPLKCHTGITAVATPISTRSAGRHDLSPDAPVEVGPAGQRVAVGIIEVLGQRLRVERPGTLSVEIDRKYSSTTRHRGTVVGALGGLTAS